MLSAATEAAFCVGVPILDSSAVVERSMTEPSSLFGVPAACASSNTE